MTTNEPGNHDEVLRKMLKEWRTDAALPPRFQELVWQRIERAKHIPVPSVWTAIAQWIGTRLPQPALATAYIGILLALGITAGWAQARQETARMKVELGERYVRALDPFQAPR